MRSMARTRVKRPAPLVNVSLVFTRQELTGLDFMARVLHLGRGGIVRRALDVLAAVGPREVAALQNVPVGDILADVHCGVCGGTEW